MKPLTAEEFIKGNEKMNSSLITDWSRSMIVEAFELYAKELNLSLIEENRKLGGGQEMLLKRIENLENQEKRIQELEKGVRNAHQVIGDGLIYRGLKILKSLLTKETKEEASSENFFDSYANNPDRNGDGFM